ncbi:MAG TPA: tryptophan synthase subunit alpha [Planctomycetes bacterium]|nr:tryptophan synthase subunit alpha [Planctomycetota bacterium]
MKSASLSGAARIEAALSRARNEHRGALVAYLVGGRPDREAFRETLAAVAARCDLLEVGMPFSDPVADGPAIARAAGRSLASGFTFDELLGATAALEAPTPLVLFSYSNPLLALGLERAPARLAEARIDGLVVPDLPFDTPEGEELAHACERSGIAWIQLVTPLTTARRRARVLERARGFVYAVLRAGTTGAETDTSASLEFLASLRRETPLPVCAGFGLRTADQARSLRGRVEGFVVGTALVERIERGEDPRPYLDSLRTALHTSPR